MGAAFKSPHGVRGRAVACCLLSGALGLALSCAALTSVFGQQAIGIGLDPGNAAVTGFSGAVPPVRIAPSADPAESTFIDPAGPSLRIVDLQHLGGPASAQLVGAPKRFTVKAEESALAVARDVGLDVTRIEQDMDSAEVTKTLAESATLARTLALNGTPSYVVGKDVVVGAVGIAALGDKIQAARTR